MSSTGFKPSMDSKREDFRKYLDRAGVMDALTKVLVSLYEEAERPEDPLDYVRKNLGGNDTELEVAKAKILELEAENAALKSEPSPKEAE